MTPRALATLLPVLVLTLGCATSGAVRPTQEAYPGRLKASQQLPDGLFWQQRVEAVVPATDGTGSNGRKVGFNAVLQSEAGVLRLLALTPMNTRAFLLEQRGTHVTYTPYIEDEIPFPPRFILIDVHRTFFAPPLPGGDGWREGERDGEVVRELWKDGRLLERSYERKDGKPQGRIRIVYRGGMAESLPPSHVELENGWFGYRLLIHSR
ncbi:MAG: DUF3261 domain-containing protein [Myxococcales bacterium]|nr:DUF3261 domain-containing protein [Myxococcales bacterium]